MKPTRWQLAWQFWLDAPPPFRILSFIALLLFLLLLWPTSCHAELVGRRGESSLRLTTDACESAAVLAEVGSTLGAKLHAAHADIEGQHFEACWIEYEHFAYVFFDDGDRNVYPMSAFKEDGA